MFCRVGAMSDDDVGGIVVAVVVMNCRTARKTQHILEDSRFLSFGSAFARLRGAVVYFDQSTGRVVVTNARDPDALASWIERAPDFVNCLSRVVAPAIDVQAELLVVNVLTNDDADRLFTRTPPTGLRKSTFVSLIERSQSQRWFAVAQRVLCSALPGVRCDKKLSRGLTVWQPENVHWDDIDNLLRRAYVVFACKDSDDFYFAYGRVSPDFALRRVVKFNNVAFTRRQLATLYRMVCEDSRNERRLKLIHFGRSTGLTCEFLDALAKNFSGSIRGSPPSALT